jgi:hypothetical protein
MKYEILEEGFVYRCPGEGPEEAAVTSRCAVTRDGEILCSLMTQSGLGQNDFAPCLAVSTDGGASWQFRGPVWPHLRERYSINGAISRSPGGELFHFGSRTPRSRPGESFWCQETLGVLPNELIWSRSSDNGLSWIDPRPVPLPLPGAAEVPAPLCVTRAGRWLAPYAPHNTFDPDLEVDLKHIVLMLSDDEGRSWRHTSMIRVEDDNSCVVEAWVTELSDGALLGTAWHESRNQDVDFPNVYALSHDQGQTWLPTRATPIVGQSAGIAPLPDGKVLFAYNQRRHDTPGVWLAVAKPTEDDFGVLANEIVWHANIPTRRGSSGKSSNWTDFAFGEPAVTVLPDGTLLVVFWCNQPDGSGIRFVKLALS